MTAITIIDEPENPLRRAPLVEHGRTFSEITDLVAAPAEHKTPRAWYLGFGLSVAILLNLGAMIGYLVFTGVGVWGNNVPVGWGWPIVNFVFWIGIGHAGTLISAILCLFRQKWRTSINRAAEAMTIFAVMCGGHLPGDPRRPHLGHLLGVPDPEPDVDVAALQEPAALGRVRGLDLLHGLAAVLVRRPGARPRDVPRPRLPQGSQGRLAVYGFFCMGWHGGNRHWVNYEKAYLILAGLSTPLVLSVHSIVSFDFAVSNLPGWHTTIFPPYFVAGAIFSGFGMVLTLMIPARSWLGLHDLITLNHLDNMAKIILLTGTMVGYAYGMEFFIAWYSGSEYEQFCFINRAFGPYWWAYWTMLSCNVFIPQVFWFRKIRRTPAVLFIVSIFVNIGMWFERFVICCTSLHRDFLPSSWGYFSPTIIDVLTYIGSFGLFFTMFLLFAKFLPVIAISEVKNVLPAASPHARGPHPHGAPTDGGAA